jgi:hypothetical protein
MNSDLSIQVWLEYYSCSKQIEPLRKMGVWPAKPSKMYENQQQKSNYNSDAALPPIHPCEHQPLTVQPE